MAATIEHPYYPIIYVRGYAATMEEVESTVATPYMGFNLGSTKLRQDYEGKPASFIFESPLIRLMKDFEYIDSYRNGALPDVERDGLMAARSVWVFRYYDPVSESLGDGERRSIPEFAAELRRFILRVRDTVCGDDKAARQAFKVNLIAHSMGGLICRCYLQNICKFGLQSLTSDERARTRLTLKELDLSAKGGAHLVHKVFTYGTPHNGIDLLGINAPNWDFLKIGTFNRDEIAKYLKLPASASKSGRVNGLNKAFPPERFFCFVGTNYKDYEAFAGLSRKGTGPMSDGLIICKNAYVDGAARAYAHRAHSGHYGIVNSEEGYQNLRRFLFGDIRVDVLLELEALTYPLAIQKLQKEKKDIKASYYIESVAKVRGGNVNLHERRMEHASAARKQDRALKKGKMVHLLSTFLDTGALPKEKADNNEPLAFALQLAIKAPLYEVDNRFWFDDYFEGEDLFSDTFTFNVAMDSDGYRMTYGLRSVHGHGVANEPPDGIRKMPDHLEFKIGFGFDTKKNAKPGGDLKGSLILRARVA